MGRDYLYFMEEASRVVPEIEGMEQQILTGETPDPSRIPSGCRFHPRCPLAVDRCTTTEPVLTQLGASRTACLLVPGGVS